jgi:CBS domain-containing protein
MRTIEEIRRPGISIGPDKTIRDGAVLMEQSGIGSLVVVEHEGLVGIVTDRDLVRRGLAKGLPVDARIDGVMSSPVISIDVDADVATAFELLRTHKVRRLAVLLNRRFIGMISVDDLIVELAVDLRDLSGPVRSENLFPEHDGPVPAIP